MKVKHLIIWLVLVVACSPIAKEPPDLYTQQWIHGSADCNENKEVPIQVVQYNESTWILRQNKCTNYEAPFMFLFLGQDRALLMDTGATEAADVFPLQETISKLISDWELEHNKSIELVVAHTHAHGDHHAADSQFKGRPNTTVVGLQLADVKSFFPFSNWPNDAVDFELGNRTVKIIPIPGHQEASLAIYDPLSKILLTGDTFYPGRLYVNDWNAFKESINRLNDFVNNHPVDYILGNHIEMTATAGVDFPVGTTYQPEEHPLPLTKADLNTLHKTLQRLGDNPVRETLANFIIYPK